MGRSMLQNSRYNFYTTISKRPGRLGDYRVLTTPLGRPNPPLPCLADIIYPNPVWIDICLMSYSHDEGLGRVVDACV